MYMYAMQGMAGMTDTQFDGKIKQLETERQQRIQVHEENCTVSAKKVYILYRIVIPHG